MMIYGKLLALCVFHPNVWSGTAFVVQAPKTITSHGPTWKTAVRSSSYSDFSDALSRAPGRDRGPASMPPPSSGASSSIASRASGMQPVRDIWDTLTPVKVQGGSLRTWSFESIAVEQVQVLAKTEGRPLNANIELWQGPDNTPQKMGVYIEDGRPFSAVIATPRGSNAIAIRNTATLEFPFGACVEADSGLGAVINNLAEKGEQRIVQGGAVHTYPFSPYVESVQVLLGTDGRPLNARIELLQGPNNIKQVVEIYTEDGMERPFFAVIETPGTGNVIRIVNTATVEYPLTACVEPYMVASGSGDAPLVGRITGGSGGAGDRRPIW